MSECFGRALLFFSCWCGVWSFIVADDFLRTHGAERREADVTSVNPNLYKNLILLYN